MKEQSELAALLDIALTLRPDNLAGEDNWKGRVGAALGGHEPAPLDQQAVDLSADMRELLRHALTDARILDTTWFWQRAHRALSQHEGVIGPGESCMREYRWATNGGWSDWMPLLEDGTFNAPPTRTQVRWVRNGKPFQDWGPTKRTLQASNHRNGRNGSTHP